MTRRGEIPVSSLDGLLKHLRHIRPETLLDVFGEPRRFGSREFRIGRQIDHNSGLGNLADLCQRLFALQFFIQPFESKPLHLRKLFLRKAEKLRYFVAG